MFIVIGHWKIKMDTIIDLLRKIKTLADNGIDGEREVAQKKFMQLLLKYDLTLDDIVDQSISWHAFGYKNVMEKSLLLQCVGYIMQTREVRHAFVRNRKKLIFQITKTQAVDLTECYEHYKKELNGELDMFFSAFIHKHRIFGPLWDGNSIHALSSNDRERLVLMINGMNSKSWTNKKQISHDK